VSADRNSFWKLSASDELDIVIGATVFGKGNVDGLTMFKDTTDFCMKLLKAEWKVNQQEGEEEFKCYMIWQWWWPCDLNGRLRTERDGDTEKGCQNMLYSRRLLMMMMMMMSYRSDMGAGLKWPHSEWTVWVIRNTVHCSKMVQC